MNPQVSVIIPAYRCVGTLEQSVRSALCQTVSGIEVIVLNATPEDGSEAILNGIAKEDERLRVIPIEETVGVAGARNRGVAEAKAKWLAFLDSDDIWESDKLARELALAKETGAALVYTAAACIGEDGKPTGKIFSVPETVTADGILRGNDIVTSSVLVRRSAYRKHPMDRSDLHEDLICWYQILKDGEKAVGVNEPLVRYRISGGSKSGNKWRSAAMTWRSYRHLGIGFFRRVACFVGYCVHGVKRYWL